METTINNIHLQIIRNKSVYQVFADKSLLPIDMEFRGQGWEFISDETPEDLMNIQSQISDFIQENSK